jgi:hypothetical protein
LLADQENIVQTTHQKRIETSVNEVTQNTPIREKLLLVDDDFRLSEMLRD